ncbi:uncharacterized protein [Narcine bancroftii]|uniref:uncharacterized protein n=1 Tax=Narcine bancroftii TaxID=1343680 RepID=UPI0038319A31
MRDKEMQYRNVLAIFEEFGLPDNPPIMAPIEIACRPPPYAYVESQGTPDTPDGTQESRPLYPDIETLGHDRNIGNRDTSDKVQAPLLKIEGEVIDVETPAGSKKIEKDLETQKRNMKKVQDNVKNLNKDVNVLGQISKEQKELMVGVLKEMEKITTTLSAELQAGGTVIGIKDEKCSTDEETRYDPPWEESSIKELKREKSRHARLDIVRTKEKDVKPLDSNRKNYLRDERERYTFDSETSEPDGDSDNSDEEVSEQGGINRCIPRVKKEQKSPKLRHQCPLLITGQGNQKYVPWSRMDLESLMKKLPPLSNGAGPWISCFERETCQEQLALADVRTIMIKIKAEGALKQIERILRSSKLGDEIEFDPLRNRFWEALRETFPTPYSLDALVTLQLKEGETAHEYLSRAWDLWETGTGERPDHSPLGNAHFCNGTINGLPGPVQAKLKDIVGLEKMSEDLWKRHLTHALKRHRQSEQAKSESASQKGVDKTTDKLMRAIEQIGIKLAAQQIVPQAMGPVINPGPQVRNGWERPLSTMYRGEHTLCWHCQNPGHYQQDCLEAIEEEEEI